MDVRGVHTILQNYIRTGENGRRKGKGRCKLLYQQEQVSGGATRRITNENLPDVSASMFKNDLSLGH
jgi:hypothetical protein